MLIFLIEVALSRTVLALSFPFLWLHTTSWCEVRAKNQKYAFFYQHITCSAHSIIYWIKLVSQNVWLDDECLVAQIFHIESNHASHMVCITSSSKTIYLINSNESHMHMCSAAPLNKRPNNPYRLCSKHLTYFSNVIYFLIISHLLRF